MWLLAAAAFAQTCPCVWLGQAAGWEEPQPTCTEHALSPPSYLQDVDIDNDADARAEYSEKVRRQGIGTVTAHSQPHRTGMPPQTHPGRLQLALLGGPASVPWWSLLAGGLCRP